MESVSSAAVPGTEPARKTRSDFGSVKASDRDKELLGLVAEQYALTLPQLARLIGRAPHTARWLRDRWVRAGWASSGQLAVGLPPFVWLTVRGSRLAEPSYRTWDANPGLARHIQAVSEVRLLEHELVWAGGSASARSPRRARRARGAAAPRRRRARSEGKRIAIEVELARAAAAYAILDDLCQRHEQVRHFRPGREWRCPRPPHGHALAQRPLSDYPPLTAELPRRTA